MKQFLLAAVASIALSLPAMAQTHGKAMQPGNAHQSKALSQYTHAQNTGGRGRNSTDRQAQNAIDPSHLSGQQIRRIQTALDREGFNVKRVDGKWGPETEAALKNFQRKQDLQGHGRLNQQTLGALGVRMNGQAEGAATTGSASKEDRMNAPTRNPGAMNDNDSGHSSNAGQSAPQMNGQTNGSNSESSPAINDGH